MSMIPALCSCSHRYSSMMVIPTLARFSSSNSNQSRSNSSTWSNSSTSTSEPSEGTRTKAMSDEDGKVKESLLLFGPIQPRPKPVLAPVRERKAATKARSFAPDRRSIVRKLGRLLLPLRLHLEDHVAERTMVDAGFKHGFVSNETPTNRVYAFMGTSLYSTCTPIWYKTGE